MSRKISTTESVKRLAIGSMIAAVVGYIAGVLSAPKSGQQTRKDIKDAGDKSRADAEKELKSLLSELNDLIKEAKTKGSKVGSKTSQEAKTRLSKAADAKDKVREIISAIHDGDANDHDLKIAVNNASSAIEHLKEFIKK